MRCRLLLLSSLILPLAACHDADVTAPSAANPNVPSFALAPTVAGFYFLPPLVKAQTYSGTFDAALSPVVRICAVASGTCTGADIAVIATGSGPGAIQVNVGKENYSAVWSTKGMGLDPSKDYRLRVYVGTTLLGSLDLDVVASAKDVKAVADNMVSLVLDQPLQIKFRIETGIVGSVTVAPGTAWLLVGKIQQLEAALLDLHGNPIAAPITWSSGNSSVTTVSPTTGTSTVATAVSEGNVIVTASAAGVQGTATVHALLLTTKIGESTIAIPRADVCGRADGWLCESLIGDVVSDAMRVVGGADFAITNSGGLRADLTCPPGGLPGYCSAYTAPNYDITRGRVSLVLPFGNKLVTVEVAGNELKTMLENGVWLMPAADGRFPQVSGLCFTYDISAAPGNRVTGAVRTAGDGSCTGAAVDLTAAARYVIAENDYMAGGGNGYPVFTGRTTTHALLDQVVTEYVGAHTPISPATRGRVACTSSGATACPVNYTVVIGQSTVAIPRADACGVAEGTTCESLVGDAVTDAMRAAAAVDFAIMNSGGLRDALTCPAGGVPGYCDSYSPPNYRITQGTVYQVLPFGDHVVTVEVGGDELKTMLENGVSSMPAAAYRFAQVSGLCFTYDISATAGTRVTGAVRTAGDGSCTGAAIDLTSATRYVIAENSYMATGGDGYPNFTGRTTTGGVVADVVAARITASSPISPALRGRIACTTSGATPCPVVTP